jgi:hypothetical protein
MPYKLAPIGRLGSVSAVQSRPLQRRTVVVVSDPGLPGARQVRREGHETLVNESVSLDASGVSRQVAPLHQFAIGTWAAELLAAPTAMQNDLDGQEMPK